MARGSTLEASLDMGRAEARLSLLPANNVQVRATQIVMIQREQERLWEDFAWPHMRVHVLQALSAGQYEYAVPATLTMDRIEHISVKDGGIWRPLDVGIGDEQYSVHESALDERAWPVRRWQPNSDDEIEVWPVPDTNGTASTYEGYLRITGIKSLGTFISDSDTADLDDRLISLYVAGAILAASGAKDAQLKLESANKLYTKLKGKQTKTATFNMFGTTNRKPVRRRAFIGRYEA